MFKYIISSFFITQNLFCYLVVEHDPVKYFLPNYRIKISAQINEYGSIFSVAKVKFRISNDKNREFFGINMNCGGEKIECFATIPAPTQIVENIEYFIEVIDKKDDGFRTPKYSVPRIKLPAWQKIDQNLSLVINNKNILDTSSFSYKSGIKYTEKDKNNINLDTNTNKELNNFEENKSSKLNSLYFNEEQQSYYSKSNNNYLDLTGIWSVKRTLSSCSKELYSYKIIKLNSDKGVVSDMQTFAGGTNFAFSEINGYSCRLTTENNNKAMIGEKVIFKIKDDLLNKLKEGIGRYERIELLEFSKDRFVFELHSDSKILTTIYTRENNDKYFK